MLVNKMLDADANRMANFLTRESLNAERDWFRSWEYDESLMVHGAVMPRMNREQVWRIAQGISSSTIRIF